MRICFVTHAVKKGDGQGRVNYEVIVEALRKENKITIISSELSKDLMDHPNVEWLKINVGKTPTYLIKYQIFAVISAMKIWRRRNQFDLVVVNGFITYASSDVNCVHFVHSAWVNSSYHPFQEQKNFRTMYQLVYNGVNALLERSAFKRTRHIVAVSEQVKKELIVKAKVTTNNISVISNGVDLNEFYPRKMRRSDFNLDEGKIYALFAGDLKSKRKNLDTVLQAIANTENINLLVLGSTHKSPYPSIAEKLGIMDRVHFMGYRKDISNLMSLSDLFIFPSRYEPFSLVVLEAMASGLPVITSNRCGVVELLSKDAAIVLKDPDDAFALSNILKELAFDDTKLKKMSVQARNDALPNQWTNMAIKYLELFHATNMSRFTSNNGQL